MLPITTSVFTVQSVSQYGKLLCVVAPAASAGLTESAQSSQSVSIAGRWPGSNRFSHTDQRYLGRSLHTLRYNRQTRNLFLYLSLFVSIIYYDIVRVDTLDILILAQIQNTGPDNIIHNENSFFEYKILFHTAIEF